MEKIICELKGISKSYQNKIVLDNINIKLHSGEMYGFIGKNGAGKTTTMRLIVGLSLPSKGDIYLDGRKDKSSLCEKRKKIGCMIETPALYMGMSARNNLEAIRILYGISDKNRINEILRLIGLEDAGKKAVKNFSLGMKQRLGIGIALMNNPEFLILDEPINGLDPNGIVEIRELIKKINKEFGTTILISSHILSELYQTVKHYIFIDKGKIIEEISHKELEEKCKKYILVKSVDINNVKKILSSELNTENFRVMEDGSIRIYDYTDDLIKIMNAFANAGIATNNISVAEDSLEEYFFKRIN